MAGHARRRGGIRAHLAEPLNQVGIAALRVLLPRPVAAFTAVRGRRGALVERQRVFRAFVGLIVAGQTRSLTDVPGLRRRLG